MAPNAPLGERVETACRQAQREVFFAAPFIKRQALQRLVSLIPESLPLTVVVRFLPLDIASGVTDAEIVGDLLARKNTRVLAQPALHAKIYRIDDITFVGSANLTNRALGWTSAPNIEVLVDVPATQDDVRAAEDLLVKSAYTLTLEMAAAILANLPKVEIIAASDTTPAIFWIPACRRPASIWEVYATGDAPTATRSVVEAAKRDLQYLQIAPDLPRTAFQQVVRAAFVASPFCQMLHARIALGGITDDEGPQWLKETFDIALVEDPADVWANVKEWLREWSSDTLHFSSHVERITAAQTLRK